jgi:dihydroxyacetone kinase-like predicted kinase
LVVVGGGGLYHVHVHTSDPDVAVEVGRRSGEQRDVRITPLRVAGADCLAGQARAVRLAGQVCVVVAVVGGPGLERAFRSLGAVTVIADDDGVPGEDELAAAIEAAAGEGVLVLPNHPRAIAVAERVASRSILPAVVVPTRSMTAGLAAATSVNPVASLEQNTAAAKGAAEASREGELRRAGPDARRKAGDAEPEQWIGTVDGVACVVEDSAPVAAVALVDRLADGGGAEVVTVVLGAGAGKDGLAVEEELRRRFPDLKVEALDGGQSHVPFLIGVE